MAGLTNWRSPNGQTFQVAAGAEPVLEPFFNRLNQVYPDYKSAGGYAHRPKRTLDGRMLGGLSTHATGYTLDVKAPDPVLRQMAQEFPHLTWGGKFSHYDPVHFEFGPTAQKYGELPPLNPASLLDPNAAAPTPGPQPPAIAPSGGAAPMTPMQPMTPMTPYSGPSPDDVAQQRRMAQMLMQQATSTEPVGHWTQALARVVQGGVGGMYRNAAQEGERQITDAGNTALTQALGSPDAKSMIPYLLGNPGTRQMGQQLLLEQAKRNIDPTAALEAERLRLSIESMKDDQAYRQKSRPIELEKTQAEVDRLKKPAATIKEVNGKLVQVLPDGTTKTLYDAGPNFDKLPEYAAKSAAFASRMIDAENNVRPLIAGTLQEAADPKTGLSPLSRLDPNTGRAVRNFDPTSKETYAMEFVPERIANMTVRGSQYQQYKQAAEQWIRAFLRKESGAAINKDEFERDFQVYFPQPGNSPDVIKQKENARLEAMKGFTGETRGFFEQNNPKAAERLKSWEGGVQPSARQPAAVRAEATSPVSVSSPEQARRLPSRTRILLPDGTEGVVP